MRNALDNRKPLKPKKCKSCKEEFQPFNSLAQTCSIGCAISLVAARKERLEARKRKALRKDTRERKKALKGRSEWLKLAQTAFNAYIRWRDREDPCISCGEYVNDSDLICGSRWDCGHYLTRGAYPELRFSELNAHKQCSSCNGGAGRFVKKNLTVSKAYRERLIKKIGLDNVEWVEGQQKAQNWSIEDIEDIQIYYKDLLKYEQSNV
jgi:hypothetical protein